VTAGVATLIAGSGTALDADAVGAAVRAIVAQGGELGETTWLAPGTAVDLAFTGAPDGIDAALPAALAGQPIDIAVQPAEGRRKRLLVADMESTIVTRELLDELADFAGIKDQVSAITARTMQGELDFTESLRERVALLAGLPASVVEHVKALIELTPGARTLVRTMRAHGAYTALVSGGFDCFTAIAAAACGFDEHHGNRLLIGNGQLTGRVAEPIFGPSDKLAALVELTAARRLTPADAAAVGDGANDIPMLRAAGLGVAFRGKPAVSAAARFRLDYADLTGLLFVQGYRAVDLVN
jgi:phosphoserine phosphatase